LRTNFVRKPVTLGACPLEFQPTRGHGVPSGRRAKVAGADVRQHGTRRLGLASFGMFAIKVACKGHGILLGQRIILAISALIW
jgi:hypothetical protein